MIDADKRQAVFLLHQEGMGRNQIARQLNSQQGTISARRIEHVLNATLEALTDLKQVLEHGAAE